MPVPQILSESADETSSSTIWTSHLLLWERPLSSTPLIHFNRAKRDINCPQLSRAKRFDHEAPDALMISSPISICLPPYWPQQSIQRVLHSRWRCLTHTVIGGFGSRRETRHRKYSSQKEKLVIRKGRIALCAHEYRLIFEYLAVKMVSRVS